MIINTVIQVKRINLIETFVLSVCLIFYMSGCHTPVQKNNPGQLKIDSIAIRFIPDRRAGICDIKLSKGDDGEMILKGETTDPRVEEAIIKTLSNQFNKLIDSVLILPDTIQDKKYSGLVTLSVINIRKDPDDRSELVSQAILGTPVRILKKVDDWILVQTPDTYIGWTELSSVQTMTAYGMALWRQADRVITVVNSDWIYTSPDESGIIGDIVAGCILVREGESRGYTIVRFPDARQGFVKRKSVVDFSIWKAGVRCTGESIVKCASKFIGLPYLWGGTSSKAVDCSGFSKTVYYMNGIILPRDASQQALCGLDVDISSGYGHMRPGDLLFFGSRDNSKLHVTHVAVYIGDSEYINSSVRVQVNSLDSMRSNYNSYRVKSLLAVKRIIGSDDDPGIMRIETHPWY